MIVTDYRALLSESYWYVGPFTGQPAFLTYSFSQQPTSFVTTNYPSAAATFRQFSESDKAAARAALTEYSAVSGVQFVEVIQHEGDITFGYYELAALGSGGSAGTAWYPWAGASYSDQSGHPAVFSNDFSVGGDVFMDIDYADDPFKQSDLPHVLVHEIGHALGLKHPFGAGAYTLDPALDNGSNTVMSYNGVRMSTLGPLDVAAIQYIYGVPGAPFAFSWSWDATTETLTVHSTTDNQYLRGSGAQDIVHTSGEHSAVVTAQGDDVIYANGQPLSVNAGAGRDTVHTGLTYTALPSGGVAGTGTWRYVYLGDNAFQNFHHVEVLVFDDGVYDVGSAVFTPAVSILQIEALDNVKSEGHSGTTPFTFSVSRSGETGIASSVTWAVSPGVPQAADATDFGGVLPGGQLTFGAGETNKTVTVYVAGDTVYESGGLSENFIVTLSNPINAVLGVAVASGIIQNDDPPDPAPSVISIAGLSAIKTEGDVGATAFTFSVTRTGSTSSSATVDWATGAGAPPAADATDFDGVLPSGQLTFDAGETNKTVTVYVRGDMVYESGGLPENFVVALSSPTNATLGTAFASGIIQNDDPPPANGNSNPVASDDSITADRDQPIVVWESDLLLNDMDPDGDALQVTGLSAPLHGNLVDLGNGSHLYSPPPGYSGEDQFSYTISDGHGGGATATVTVDVINTGGSPVALIDVYRFYNGGTGTHFYTGSTSEKDQIVANPGNDPFLAKMVFEGPAYKAFGQDGADATELYRFYNTATGAHFFTASEGEKNHIVANPANDPFLAAMTLEGVAYYVLGQDGAHAIDVWRFYNGATGVHFYTASEAEKDHIVTNPSKNPYLAHLNLEGVAFWVPDSVWGI